MQRRRWSPLAAREVLEIAASSLGLVYERLELLRFGTSAIYRLHPDPLTVRITRPGAEAQAARDEIALCAWLAQLRFPAVPPALEVAPEPLVVYGSVVSVWRWVSPPQLPEGQRPLGTQKQLGALLRGLHSISSPCPVRLPALDPLGMIAAKLRGLEGSGELEGDDARLLWRWHEWLVPRWQAACQASELGIGLVHGDAHRGNCILGSRGEPWLLDWDHAALGPREWDLIPAALGPRRFGRPRADYEDFARAYGHDVTRWPGFQASVLVRELLLTLWRLEVEAISQVRDEGRARLRYWRREPQPPVWRAF